MPSSWNWGDAGLLDVEVRLVCEFRRQLAGRHRTPPGCEIEGEQQGADGQQCANGQAVVSATTHNSPGIAAHRGTAAVPGGEDQAADFARSTLAAGALGHMVGGPAHLWLAVRHRDGKAHAPEDV